MQFADLKRPRFFIPIGLLLLLTITAAVIFHPAFQKKMLLEQVGPLVDALEIEHVHFTPWSLELANVTVDYAGGHFQVGNGSIRYCLSSLLLLELNIKQLILQGADINEIDARGIWPLLAATTYGNAQTVELLIDLGADPNLADQYNYTALHEAATLGYHDVANLLIEARANINIRDINSFTPLGYAKRSGTQAVIDLLESHGAHM